MRKRIKITTLLFVFMFVFTTHAYCFLGFIGGALSWLGSQIGAITTGVTSFSMVKNVVDGAKSVSDSYNDVQSLVNQAQGMGNLGNDALSMFQSHFNNSVQDAWQGAGQDNMTVGKYLDKTEQKSLEYMQKNWSFGDSISKRIKERDDQLAKTVKKVGSKNEKESAQGQIELAAIMAEQNQDQQRILLKLVELQLRNQELEKELKAQGIKINEEENAQNEKDVNKTLQDRKESRKTSDANQEKSLYKGILGERQY